MDIKIDDLNGGEVVQLLKEHLEDMYATSPPESVHALDVSALKVPEITFFSCWKGEQLLGCAAIKELDSNHAELKSMRTSNHARNLGVGTLLLNHVLNVSSDRGYKKISLETGSQEFFKPARNLYEKFGFQYCDPFADYKPDPHSQFMSCTLGETFS
ncbi:MULTISPECIES: GNAT family N-acetyltransferase [Aliivibrio]|uniref:GNAT family N-acetyltransferase n=5 Tax=Aliivibrio TaxID=511678 RepID=A0A4Q5K4Q9_9GAMM|nr:MULTISPECIES: GNAT family N-acetyltransferase [Aliivibrio]MDD9177032.1 GNAT family N-acetyltransferase [Aliivibrio sp. S3TY1]MDD9177060.1 GNAT family N-acetyltransferase [Aliivibrio sp. S3TY1]MDD9180703.1 GNAT family N-acetyltransferase [Aliivibrio sp. A6]MDD9194101.1 GNAT family N-acetyltransferase [Aliivibrio sp. S2TY2]MDD9194129.1 GNAT family N-acetyltransferase [Aliivibrio sp. S2TY2]